jgi:hypothetical protein
MMQGVVGQAFDLAWGVTVTLEKYLGSVRAGDTLVVGGRKWRISGIPHIRRVEIPIDLAIAVTLEGATIAELELLRGKSFETISNNKSSA